jgi:hypothetical protein
METSLVPCNSRNQIIIAMLIEVIVKIIEKMYILKIKIIC